MTWPQTGLQKWISKRRDAGIHSAIYHGFPSEDFLTHSELLMSWTAKQDEL